MGDDSLGIQAHPHKGKITGQAGGSAPARRVSVMEFPVNLTALPNFHKSSRQDWRLHLQSTDHKGSGSLVWPQSNVPKEAS